MDDMEITAIDENFRESISRCKNTDDNRAALDRGFFCPHYPYLPPGRRYAIGMQFAGKITTFVHSTHFRSSEFRVYSSLTRQTDQDSPISHSWGATANAAIRTYECTCNGTCRCAATILPVEGSPCIRLTSPSYAAAAAREGSVVCSSSPS